MEINSQVSKIFICWFHNKSGMIPPFLVQIAQFAEGTVTPTLSHNATWHSDREFKHGRELNQNCLNSERNFYRGVAGVEKHSWGSLFHLLWQMAVLRAAWRSKALSSPEARARFPECTYSIFPSLSDWRTDKWEPGSTEPWCGNQTPISIPKRF